MDRKTYLKRNSKSADNSKDVQVPSKIRKTDDNLNILTKKQLIDKIAKLNEELEALKNKVKTLDPVMGNNIVKQYSSSTQTILMDEDIPFPCQICIYNADNEMDLRIHMDYAHDIDDEIRTSKVTCNLCRKKYPSKNELMKHIKSNHESDLQACKYFQTGTCKFNDKSCWFAHKIIDMSAYKCRHCEYKCGYKSEIMKHQKERHEEKMQICKSFLQNKCKFWSKCWFSHINTTKINETHADKTSNYDNNEPKCNENEDSFIKLIEI